MEKLWDKVILCMNIVVFILLLVLVLFLYSPAGEVWIRTGKVVGSW